MIEYKHVFEVGKTYEMTSPCDHDCVWSYTVRSRTAKTITVQEHGVGKMKTLRICRPFCDSEVVYPLGRYSMCPALRAR